MQSDIVRARRVTTVEQLATSAEDGCIVIEARLPAEVGTLFLKRSMQHFRKCRIRKPDRSRAVTFQLEHGRRRESPRLRIDYGPGYRVYFTQRGAVVILLLCAGDKRTQGADIKRAIEIATAWSRWNAEEEGTQD